MKVNTPHEQYEGAKALWKRCRDTYEGEDAVKNRGELYLPKLGSHKDSAGGYARYQMYVMRASFFNAVGRTVDGLAGVALRADPQIEVPAQIKEHLEDITLRGEDLENAAQRSTRELLTAGRQGILVDVTTDGERPYWTFYSAEDIVNWRVTYKNGDPELSMVVLREFEEVVDPEDTFKSKMAETYRVLTLMNDTYAQTKWTKNDRGDWTPGTPVMPTRRGKPLSFIPFTFINPTSNIPDIEKPPLIDLVNVNLSHYRNSADLEHGLHFVGVPQIVIMGAPQTGNDEMEFGSSVVWVLDQGADAKIIQADGETLGALERALDRKMKAMATLGARMLEDAPNVERDTATAVISRSAGEHATLATIMSSIEAAYTWCLQVHAWWAKGNTAKEPREIKAVVDVSKDFSSVRMDAQTLTAWVNALQAEAISYETFWAALTRGQVARPVSAKQEMKAIEHDGEMFKKPEPAPPVPYESRGRDAAASSAEAGVAGEGVER